jgi:hypothetical protein
MTMEPGILSLGDFQADPATAGPVPTDEIVGSRGAARPLRPGAARSLRSPTKEDLR